MKYTLIGSLRSPYSRLIRLFLINNNIEFKFEMINYLEKKEDAVYLAQISPINKIPVLIDADQKIFESRVIFNYLVGKHGLKSLTVKEENIQSAVQSCLDVYVSVNLLLLKMGGLSLKSENWYIKRQRERVPLAFDFILPWVRGLNPDHPADWNYPVMSLFSYLDWATYRDLPEVKNQPELLEFVEKFKNSRGLRETDFRS